LRGIDVVFTRRLEGARPVVRVDGLPAHRELSLYPASAQAIHWVAAGGSASASSGRISSPLITPPSWITAVRGLRDRLRQPLQCIRRQKSSRRIRRSTIFPHAAQPRPAAVRLFNHFAAAMPRNFP